MGVWSKFGCQRLAGVVTTGHSTKSEQPDFELFLVFWSILILWLVFDIVPAALAYLRFLEIRAFAEYLN